LADWEDLLEEAVTVLFENLNDGLTIYEALETDKSIRAAIAVSADLGDVIQELTDMLDDGVSIDDAYDLTEDAFDDSFAEAAAVLMEMDALETEEEAIIYAALDVLYTDLEAGLTLDEALETNADLYDACEMSTDLSTTLDDIYTAIEDGYSVDEAFELYYDDLEDAVTTAAYLIVDVAIQIVEDTVQAELFAEQIEATLTTIYACLADGESLVTAVEEYSGFEDYVEAYSVLEDALGDLYDALEDGVSIDDAVAIYGEEISDAVAEAAYLVGESDGLISDTEDLLALAIENLYDNLASGMSLYEALETDMALRAAIAVSSDLGHAIDNLSNALDSGATLSEAENLVADVFIDAYTEAATVLVDLEG
jgi:hypothetical protein